MATEDEVREAADGTEAQVEVVDLGTVRLEAHPEAKLSSIMDIKSVGEIINSTEGALKIPEDQVLVEASSEIQLPPEHNLNGEEYSLNGHMEVEEKISNEQLHDNDQEEEPGRASAHQSNGINKEEATDGLSHGENIIEDSSILKCKKDEEPKEDNQQDLGVTVDNESVQEETLKSDGAIEQTDDGQQDQNQEPEKANKDTQPASIADNVDVEVVAEAPNGLQTHAEPHLDSDATPEIIDEKTKTYEQTKADGVVHPDHEESFLEDTSIAEPTEEVVKVSDQRSQQADILDADVVQEEMLKCEETAVQEEVPKSEAHEPKIDAQEVLNQESAEETVPMDENIKETEQQSNVAAPKETSPEHEATTRAPPVDIQMQNQEPLEEIEDAEAVDNEAEMQQRSVGFEDTTPEDQGATMDDDTVQETLKAIEQKDDGQQDQDLEPEQTVEDTQPASMANIPDIEVVAEAHSGVQTPVEPNLENSDAISDIVDGNTETNEPGKADSVVHQDHKESFPEDTSTAESTEEVVTVEDQQSKKADAMDADVVQEEVHKSEDFNEPETDALEVLNQESAEETDSTVNEKTEEITCQSNMETPEETNPEHDAATREPAVNIQVQNQEPLEEREDAAAVDTEAPVQQSSVAFEGAVPEDQHSLGATMDDATVQEDTLEAIEQTENGQQYQDLGPENATENTQPASTENIPNVEVIDEAPSGVQAPVEINLDNSDAIPDTKDGNTETDEPAKADGVIHPDHKESFPEDTSVAEPTEEVVKVEDQQSQQADAIDADVLQEEVPKSEPADELATNTQEMLKDSAEETDVPVNEKTEETEHKSDMASPEERMPEHDAQAREPPVNIQVQNEESLGEIEDVEAVDTEAEMKQSSVAFEETTPEDHVATTEPHSEIQYVHHVEPEEISGPGDAKDEEITNKSNTENAVQDNILQSGPTADIHPVQELKQTESKSAGIYETDEASDQTHAVVLSELAQEDAKATSEPQVTETEKDLEDTEATQEITEHDHVTPSKEISVEDDLTAEEPHNDDMQQNLEQDTVEVKDSETYHENTISTSEDIVEANVTAEEPTRDDQEVDNAESTEETKENIAENIAEVSDEVIVDEAVQQNVPQTEDIAETHTRELKAEETKSTEPIESEQASDQRNAAPFNDSAQEGNILESEMQQMESATEIKETEAIPQESNACVSEEPSPEDHIVESETNCDNKEVSITESSEVTESDKGIITGSISGQSNMVSAGNSAQETNVPESEAPAVIQAVQELGSEETKKTELEEVKEASHEINATDFQTPTQEENPGTTELHESTEVSNIEATEEQGTPHQSAAAAQSEEQATEEIAREPEILEPESAEEINDTEANEPQSIFQKNIISTCEESVPEETATEDSTTTEPDVYQQQVQDQESSKVKDIEADKPQEIASSSALSSEESTSDDNATVKEPNSDTQADNSQSAELTEVTENVKSNTALAETAAPETEANTDTSPVHEAELEESKDNEPIITEDSMTSGDLPSDKMDMEIMETEAVSHESHVASIKELSEDDTLTSNAPHADSEPVLELESVEDTKCTDTMEHSGEPHGSTSDEPIPTEENITVTEPAFNTQELQNLTSQETKDSEEGKTDELSDISSFPTPEEADQEITLPRIEPTHDVQEVQELGSTEETRDIETVEPEDHQEHRVFTLEQPAVDSEPNADDQQVHEDKLPEMKENEAVEAEEATKQSNIATTDNTAEERSGLESDPDSYVLVSQQVELSKYNENSQIVKAEETSGPSNSVALEERITEDSVASEIEPPVDIKQDNEQEPVEEIEGVDATHAEEDFDNSQADTVEKLASENNTATIELTYDIQQADDLEATKGLKNTEAISDGQQSKGAASEEPTPTDNEAKAEEHPVESNEGIKDEIQESEELKDQNQKEDEEIESQNVEQELQVDEQKSEDMGDDLTTEPLREYQNVEHGATNRTEDDKAVEAEQTEAAITEITKNEQALHISEESTPIIMDIKVESVKETSEGTEEDYGAKNDRKDEQENEENDDIVAKNSTDDEGKTTDELTNEELEHGLASSVQEASDPPPSNGKILENDPVAVTLKVESGEHREDKECTIKINDDVHTTRASEKEVADKIEENEETKNDDNAIHHDELETKPEKEETSQLCSNEPCNMDIKIDDSKPLCEEKIYENGSINPRKIEEMGENKGLDSISEPFAESSIQNNAEEDLSSHHNKVEDEKLSMAEQNAIDIEAMQEKVDEPASDINGTKKCQEENNTDDVLNLETKENPFDKIEETVSHETTETSNTTATEAVTINEDIADKVSGADVAPSDESLKIFNDTGRDLNVSSAITALKEESMNESMEDHNIDLPEHPAQDDNNPEQALCLEQTDRGMPSSERLLQTEPGENQIPNEQEEEGKQDENQILKEKNDEDMQDTKIGDAQKEVEQDLPVSSFLMNLILGKEIGDANGNLESEAETKQGDTKEDDSYVLISKQEECLGSLPTENKVDDSLTFEQEKHEIKCSEETQEMVKEQSDDLKLDTERSMETDEGFNKNIHELEIPAYEDNPQDKISRELLSEEEAGVSTKMESRDIDISSIELDDRAVDTLCQENVEASTKSENGSLRSNLNDSTIIQASEEDTLVEGQTGLLLKPLPEDKCADGVSEQAPLFTQSGMTDANDLSSDAESVQNPVCAKQDKPTESSNIEATSSPDIQMENEIDKKEEQKHANTATGEVSEENVESTHDNLLESSSSEVTSDEQATQIAESVSDTQIILAHEKGISERPACVDGKENLHTAVEIQTEGPNMLIDQDKQDEVADNETVMEPEKVGESNLQGHQKTGVEQSPKESDKGDQQVLAKKEILMKEQDVHGTVVSPKQTVSIKSDENQELFDSKVQERDLNVVSPREASETEENFVDVTKPQFSTDEEQSPKLDVEEKIKDTEGTKDFTEAAMKTEAPGAPQKAHKKHNLLSGVGSKVKHQLAKVKKAIVGKPGHTKPESPKS